MTAIIQVAVPGPFTTPLDYLPARDTPTPPAGVRVRVPLGKRRVTGVVLARQPDSRLDGKRLRSIIQTLDEQPLLSDELIDLILWTARYYHYPVGEAFATALPGRLRHGHPATATRSRHYAITPQGQATDPETLGGRAPRQAQILAWLQSQPKITVASLATLEGDPTAAMTRLIDRGLCKTHETHDYGLIEGHGEARAPLFSAEQQTAAAAIAPSNGHHTLLIEGVTGSGKTEVYLGAIEQVLAAGRQALVIVPEIGLTPQLIGRFQRRLKARIAVLHSGLADGERLNAWLAARDGQADVIIGTRSAVFAPLPNPGLIMVDEEHDASLKQAEGLRYSARDLAVLRGYRLDIPVILGSATPSLESLANARAGRYGHVQISKRAGGARPPALRLLDMRGQPTQDGLSQPLLDRVGQHLADDGQVLLFLNRRGFAPVLICHECGWLAECDRCDARYTYHRQRQRLQCHHCDREQRLPAHCPQCGSADLRPLGLGTERIESALRASFPDHPLVRIDRDSTRRRGSFEQAMADARRGETRLLLGTQMLAKGHHLPAVTLVAIIDADQGLFSADFRGPERLAQLIIQVAGRAGRAERAGEVVIQTHNPEHPLLQTLLAGGYPAFAQAALAERQAAGLPPATAMALLRAEAVDRTTPMGFLTAAADQAPDNPGVECIGPYPAPMERRAGRYRAQLMVQAVERRHLQGFLDGWLPRLATMPSARRVRWSVDVDPAETL
jgi:primosomal protein N' (replication factor Y)